MLKVEPTNIGLLTKDYNSFQITISKLIISNVSFMKSRIFSSTFLFVLFVLVTNGTTTFAQTGGTNETFKAFIEESLIKLKSSPAQFEAECLYFPMVFGSGNGTAFTYDKLETISKEDMVYYFSKHLKQLSKKNSFTINSYKASEETMTAFQHGSDYDNSDANKKPVYPYSGIINSNDLVFEMMCNLPDETFVIWYGIFLDDTTEFKIWGALYGM